MHPKFTRRSLLAFALVAGLPFGFFFEALPALLHQQAQLPLTVIGLASLTQLPWIAKPLWAPFVDGWSTPRRWLVASAAGMAAGLLLLALLPIPPPLSPLLLGLTTFCCAAATQDLVVDAAFVRFASTHDANALQRAGALRMAGYKVALHGGSALCILGADTLGWRFVLLLLAAVQGLGSAALAPLGNFVRGPPAERTSSEPSPTERLLATAQKRSTKWLRAWLSAPDMACAIAFIFAYKLILGLLGPMGKPLWLELGISARRLGAVAGGLGLLGALGGIAAASVVAGRLPLGVSLALGSGLEAFCALLYTAAWHLQQPRLLAPALLCEGLAQGLTTTLLLTVLARLCTPRHAASQFAWLSATFALSRALAAAVSGLLAERLGWGIYLALLPWMGLPGLSVLPGLLRRLRATPPTAAAQA